MIAARGISKQFGSLRVLDRLDLAIARGRVTGLVGPNAAGKTTLIKVMLGLTRPDAGSISFDGAVLNGGTSHRARMGYMPQIARFPDNLTGAELIAMLQELRGHRTARDEELIDQFGLARELGKPFRTLSGGTRQKINAVIAFLFRPDLLILDEPTAGLDPVSSGIFKDKVLAERGEGRTVIVTSHLMAELEELVDDVAFLLDGQVSFFGSVSELKATTRQANLERAVATLMLRARSPLRVA